MHCVPDLLVDPARAIRDRGVVAVLLVLLPASRPLQAALGLAVVGAALPVYRMMHGRRASPFLEAPIP